MYHKSNVAAFGMRLVLMYIFDESCVNSMCCFVNVCQTISFLHNKFLCGPCDVACVAAFCSWKHSWSQLSLTNHLVICWTLVHVPQRVLMLHLLGQALYAAIPFLFSFITGIISSEPSSNYSAKLMFVLPKVDVAEL